MSGEWQRVSCADSDMVSRASMSVSSSLTNFVNGEVLDPRLPPHTVTTWANSDGEDVLRDQLDEDGCKHWMWFDVLECP